MGQAKSYLKCTFEDQLLKLEAVSVNGSVYDELSVEKEGEDVIIGLNCRFILNALKSADTDQVELILNGPLSPILFYPVFGQDEDRSDGRNYLYMVSPVKMRE